MSDFRDPLDDIKERLSDATPSNWFQSKFSRTDVEWLVGQLEATRDALAFYADEASWDEWCPPYSVNGTPPAMYRHKQIPPVIEDEGSRARAALGEES